MDKNAGAYKEGQMKIVINHDNCQHAGAFADRCLAATIRNPLGHERYCAARVEDDGRPRDASD